LNAHKTVNHYFHNYLKNRAEMNQSLEISTFIFIQKMDKQS